jgi:osmotically inducible protein OsmC
MPLMQTKATVAWSGDLMNGFGKLSVDSGAFPELPVTFAARTESQDGKTTPEELLAGAHAICYSMVLANMLAKNDTPADTFNVTAECTLDRVESGLKITRMDLTVEGKVAGVEAADFQRIAREAEQACPVSNALRGNVEIAVNTK